MLWYCSLAARVVVPFAYFRLTGLDWPVAPRWKGKKEQQNRGRNGPPRQCERAKDVRRAGRTVTLYTLKQFYDYDFIMICVIFIALQASVPGAREYSRVLFRAGSVTLGPVLLITLFPLPSFARCS